MFPIKWKKLSKSAFAKNRTLLPCSVTVKGTFFDQSDDFFSFFSGRAGFPLKIRSIDLLTYKGNLRTLFACSQNELVISQCNSIANNKKENDTKFFILLQIWGFGFGDDGTDPADEPKRTKRVQGWSRQIMTGFFLLLLFAILLHCKIPTSFV